MTHSHFFGTITTIINVLARMKGLHMLAVERRFKIMSTIQEKKIVSTSELAATLEVSEMTIRRDLNQLARDGLLKKTHGGAVARDIVTEGPSFAEKVTLYQEEKANIGRAAADLIEEGDIIALNTGTTTLQVARHIEKGMVLTIVTNSLNIAMLAAGNTDIRLIVTGGTLRERSFALVGSLANKALSEIRVNRVFLGINGVSIEHGITTADLLEASTDRALVEIAKEVNVVADHSKIGRVSLAPIVSLEFVERIITDSGISEADQKALEETGTQILIAR